jgi:hypothetical protein
MSVLAIVLIVSQVCVEWEEDVLTRRTSPTTLPAQPEPGGSMTDQQFDRIHPEDAVSFTVKCLKGADSRDFTMYGYELYVPRVVERYLKTVHGIPEREARDGQSGQKASRAFYDAAWSMCRRGILRPGVTQYGQQVTDSGSGGAGFALTPQGRRWLEHSDAVDLVPTEPSRFAQMLDNVGGRYGPGFQERALEAVRCYEAQTYLACCAMCGAAAETVILSLAVEKTGDAAKIIKDYESAGGRGRIENLLLGQQRPAIQNEFRGYTSLLKYWRDSAAHATAADISDPEAYTSLALLLRMAKSADDNWVLLTGSGQ